MRDYLSFTVSTVIKPTALHESHRTLKSMVRYQFNYW